jgi:predicted RNase H-like HicB family nuclease
MKYLVILEPGPENWGAHVPDLPGCMTVGEMREEAAALIRDAVATHIEGLREEGAPIPRPVSEATFVEA